MRGQLYWVALASALTGCYEVPDPAGFPGSEIATLSIIDGVDVLADGDSIVHLELRVAPNTSRDTAITVETSSGALSASADPTSAEARRISVNNRATGVIPLVMRVGNKPGTTIITANVGGYVTTQELELSPSLPDRIILSAPKTSTGADGASKFSVTATLLAPEAKMMVSRGVRVRFAICCPNAEGGVEPCSSEDPAIIASEAQLGDGQAILVEAVTLRIVSDVQPPQPIPLVVVAQAVNRIEDESIGLCGAASAAAVRNELSLAVLPIAP